MKVAKFGDIVETNTGLYGVVTHVRANSVIIDLSIMGKENSTDFHNRVVNHKNYTIRESKKIAI